MKTKSENFKVSFCKKDVIYFMAFFVIALVACIFILFNEKYRKLSVFGITFTIGAMLVFVSTILFKMEVEKNYFKVRTKLGKKFEFNLSEIERVFCIKRSGVKVGTNYYIKLYAREHFFEVNSSMDGFEIMAKYLLKKYKNGEMYKDAISDYNMEQLKIYSDKDKREN
jgi:uncharacterized integral membrane protein